MRILVAGGGTGGHIYPALAVVRAVRARVDAEFRWIGGHRGLEARVVSAAGIRFERLLLRSLRTVDLSLATAVDPFRLAASFPQATALLARHRPAAVFTTGGYVALPVIAAAAALRVPVLLWEGNVVPGRSVRVTAPAARVVSVAFESTCAALPGDCYVTGTPIRPLHRIDREAARARFGLAPGERCLLVFGGSQAVRRFSAAVADALPALVERSSLIHITGHDGYGEALQRREALPADRRERYKPYPFLGDEMQDALVAADLVVGRADPPRSRR